MLDESRLEGAHELSADPLHGNVQLDLAGSPRGRAASAEATAKLVEFFTERFVVRPQRLQHVPDVLEGGLVQYLVGILVRGDEEGQDDGPELLGG